MGLLGELYNAFGLVYSSVLAAREHKHFKSADWALLGASIGFVFLSIASYLIQVLSIPWGYKWRFIGKSLARGLLAPLLSLLHYPILFGCSSCVKRALTFSNEAHDGVERTRQLKIFELTHNLESPVLYKTKHDLFRYERRNWGYDRRVGDICVRVRFEAHFIDDNTIRKLQTSDWGRRLFLQYKWRATASPPQPQPNEPIIEVIHPQGVVPSPGPGTQATVQDPCLSKAVESVKGCLSKAVESVKGCCRCECGDLESGVQIPGTPSLAIPNIPRDIQNPPKPYKVTITWRYGICRLHKCKCSCCSCFQRNGGDQNQQPETCCMWNLFTRGVVRNWTLFQIHQYMLCLDAWGNHPKQGIWRPHKPRKCYSGCTPCCNSCSNEQFRYCYRHDELVDAIDKGGRLTRTWNNATWYTVV